MELEYNMAALGIPLFLLLILLEYLVLRLKGKNFHTYSDSITSGSMGACLLITESLLKVYTFGVFVWIWQNYRLFDFESTSLVTWIVFFFGVDFFYYWFHRVAHERNILWGAHEGHHQGEEFNYTTAIRQSAFQYGFSWIFYLPLAFMGCPPEVFLGQFLILKGYQFWIHTKGIIRIPVIEGIFSTPSSHRVHHAKNPIYIDRNYGGTLVIWDRMFGTWQPELNEEICHYGTTHPTNTLNPVRLNLRHWLTLFHDSFHTQKWSDKIGLWFKPTGWRPLDCVDKENHLQREGTENRENYNPLTTRPKQIYAGLISVLTFTAGVMFIFLSPQLNWDMKILGAVLFISGVVVGADLLENRSRLIPFEVLRLPTMIWFITTLWSYPVTTTIVDRVVINKPANEALAYAGNVSLWPQWHSPSNQINVKGSSVLTIGETFGAIMHTPTGLHKLNWTVNSYLPNEVWSATAKSTNNSEIELIYRVSPTNTNASTNSNGTLLERRLTYTLNHFPSVVVNAVSFSKKIKEESKLSLSKLKNVMETD